jgi:hypothetical protein
MPIKINRMKSTFICLIALCLTISAQAQNATEKKSSKFFLRLGGGYAFAAGGQTRIGGWYLGDVKSVTRYNNNNLEYRTETAELKKASFGAGIKAVVAGGVMFNKHVGLELGVSVGVSQPKYVYDYKLDETGSAPTYTYKYTAKNTRQQKTPVLLMPAIIVESGAERLNVYSRFGAVISMGARISEEIYLTELHSTNPTTYGQKEVYELRTRAAFGFHGALGAQYKLDEKIALYLEVNGVSLHAMAKKATLKELSANGTDYMSQASVSKKEIQYEMSYDATFTPKNENEPTKAPAFSVPLSNVGFGIGLTFKL